MIAFTPSSMPVLNPMTLESATIAPDHTKFPSTVPLQTDWRIVDNPLLAAKWAIDLVGAFVGLLFLAPVMLGVALSDSAGFTWPSPVSPVETRISWSSFLGSQVPDDDRGCRTTTWRFGSQ